MVNGEVENDLNHLLDQEYKSKKKKKDLQVVSIYV